MADKVKNSDHTKRGKANACKPEVIVKVGVHKYDNRNVEYEIPKLTFIANRAGFRKIAAVFEREARRIAKLGWRLSASNGHSIWPSWCWHDDDVSDYIELECIGLTPHNRRRALLARGITRRSSSKGRRIE